MFRQRPRIAQRRRARRRSGPARRRIAGALPQALPNFHNRDAAASHTADLKHAVGQLASTLLGDTALSGAVYERFLQQVEPSLLAALMAQAGRQSAARALVLHRTTLKKKLDEYGIEGKI